MRFIAKQNPLMEIGNNGNLVLGPFDESTPCLMIVLMNCQTKLRINHLVAVKSVVILGRIAEAFAASTATNSSIKNDDEDVSVIIPPVIRSKYYNPPVKRPYQDKRHNMYNHFRCVHGISRP
ncbi:hypothetical protein TNCV_3800391 [Trichonephila clavipes]|nr:hypothetical protein TNCV_3800391 [Trichonephila clavipes]